MDTFRAKIVDVSSHFYTLEVTGNESKISAIIELLKGFGIVEIARTGKAALARNRLLEPERDEFLALEEKATLALTKTAVIKVSVDSQNRAEVLRIVDLFRGRIVDVGPDSCTVEVTGNEGAISGILELLKDFGVSHIARPRRAAVAKSRKLEFQLGELLHFTGKAAHDSKQETLIPPEAGWHLALNLFAEKSARKCPWQNPQQLLASNL